MSTRLHVPRAQNVPSLAPPAHSGARSGGRALDRHTQAEMSARFGHDFSRVRIHTDAHAEDAAAALGANAFAHGSDIVFGAGQYTDGSSNTKRLLAHELTHVVQQARGGAGDPSRTSDRADEAEREADALAADVAAGRKVEVQARPGAAVARQAYDPWHPGTCSARDSPDKLWNPMAGPQPTMGAAPQPAGSSQPESSSVYDFVTNNALSAGTSIAESALSASRFGGPFSAFNKFANPLGLYSNSRSFGEDIRGGNFGKAGIDAAAFTSSAIGTASTVGLIESGGAGAATALGIAEAGSVLNPIGAAAGAFAGGYTGGTMALDAANNYAAHHNLMGGGRTTTEASGDAGQWVDEGVHSLTDWIPGIGHGLGSLVGGPLGALTAMGSGLVTEAYTGVRAAGSGIAHGLGWLKDGLFGKDVEVDTAGMNKAQEGLNQTMDARDMDAERARLYGGGGQVAHEEMPPLPRSR